MRALLVVAFLLAFLGGASTSVTTSGASSKASPAAEAPAAPEAHNLTALMSRKGCRRFAGLLSSTAGAAQTYEDNIVSGLTVFCPADAAVDAFQPQLKNLTADGTLSLLLYHAIPIYESLPMLRSSNGVDNTLATDGAARDFNLTVQNDGNDVTLRTAAPDAAHVTATLLDADPVAVFAIDAVLQPRELFPPPAAAPAPATPAGPPDAGMPPSPPASEAPGPVSDSPSPKKNKPKASGSGRGSAHGGAAAMAAASLLAGAVMLF